MPNIRLLHGDLYLKLQMLFICRRSFAASFHSANLCPSTVAKSDGPLHFD